MQALADRCSFSPRAQAAGISVGPAISSGALLAAALLAVLAGCSDADDTQLGVAEGSVQNVRQAPALPTEFGTLHQALSAGPMWTQFGAPEDHMRSLASAVDGAGQVYVFGLAADGSPWQNVQAPDWSGWQLFGNGTERLRTLAAHRAGDGRVEVFGTAPDGSIWVIYQLAVGGSWSDWEVFGNFDDRLRSVTPVVDAMGLTQVFGLADDDSIWSKVQQPSGDWSGWQIFGHPDDRLATVAAQLSADGRIEVFGTEGSIWVNSQTGVEGGWSGWQVFGNPEDRLRVVTPVLDAAGNTQLIGLADDDAVWINSQLSEGWSGWQLLGANEGGRVHTLAVGEDADGRLEVAGIALGGSLWRTAQDSPAGAWSPWVEFGSPEDQLQSLLLERGGDGKLLALGTAPDDSIWLNTQQLPGQWPELPLPLQTNFFATATLTTTYGDAPGPYAKPVLLDFTFNSSRTTFSVAAFNLEAATFSTPLGTNTTTIRYAGGGAGTFDAATGALDMTFDLVFDHSIRLPSVDSTLRVALSSSGPGGFPLDPTSGAAAMGGSGTFRGGVLAGETGDLLLSGIFDPIP